ncbi:MAG: inositol monophosphatase [Candidatus Saccharibacteria bacterium]|nr:inositol monophosphatase [Candidatus Saccharibacteria bacterium]
MDYKNEIEFAKNMAIVAGEIMKKYYRVEQGVEIKEDNTPVTLADKEINDLLIESVKTEFPEHGVLGEEASWNEDREKLWVCDPIDGTVPYILHVPTSAFSLALVIDGVPTVAVIYNPWIDEVYTAVKGKGAFRGKDAIHVSTKMWGNGVHVGNSGDVLGNPISAEFSKDLYKGEGVIVNNIPGLAYTGATIAEGVIDGKIFTHHTAHDIAALKLIIEEAGGKVTDLEGNEQRYDQRINGAIMTNGLIHDKLVEIVGQVR